METASLTCSSTMEAKEPRQSATLPKELLLDIIARSDDVTTVVRCTVGSKALRRAMLGLGFFESLKRRTNAYGGFNLTLRMTVSYRPPGSNNDNHRGTAADTRSIIVQPPWRLKDTDLHLRSLETASTRDAVLVGLPNGILVVSNTITGQRTTHVDYINLAVSFLSREKIYFKVLEVPNSAHSS